MPRAASASCSRSTATSRRGSQAEEARARRERQLRFVTDSAPVLIAHCDRSHRFKFVNKPYAARFGLHPSELIGRSIPDVLGADAYETITRT